MTGANGFIGSHVAGALLEANHEVLGAVRRPRDFQNRFPSAEAIHCDLNRDLEPGAWMSRLYRVDAVINCAGILQGGLLQHAGTVHVRAPLALFEACRQAGITRVIHLSAVSAEASGRTTYAATKAEAEKRLSETNLDWIILRPSLVYAAGSYGATSLLRGVAGLPGILPIAGRGDQPFRPIHARDLAMGIVRLLERNNITRKSLEPAGPDVLTLREILLKRRTWLGFGRAVEFRIPSRIVQAAARIGDLTGAATFNTTAVRQLEAGNTGDPESFTHFTGVASAPMDQWLLRQPSHVQDRWHARLVWLVPCLRCVLAILWVVSGLVGLLAEQVPVLRSTAGFFPGLVVPLVLALCALDIAIGLAILVRWRARLLGAIQLIVVAAYTIALSLLAARLWANPLGPLLKNLPILAAIGSPLRCACNGETG